MIRKEHLHDCGPDLTRFAEERYDVRGKGWTGIDLNDRSALSDERFADINRQDI